MPYDRVPCGGYFGPQETLGGQKKILHSQIFTRHKRELPPHPIIRSQQRITIVIILLHSLGLTNADLPHTKRKNELLPIRKTLAPSHPSSGPQHSSPAQPAARQLTPPKKILALTVVFNRHTARTVTPGTALASTTIYTLLRKRRRSGYSLTAGAAIAARTKPTFGKNSAMSMWAKEYTS